MSLSVHAAASFVEGGADAAKEVDMTNSRQSFISRSAAKTAYQCVPNR